MLIASFDRPMFSALQRHPFAVEAYFRWSLVLAYALPARVLRPLLPPGLELDTHGDVGFLAIALVQTEGLRPKGLPKVFGRNFFLSGYRVFARFAPKGKQALRGLRILRSDTDRRSMVTLGNVFTHYGYEHAKVSVQREGELLQVRVQTRDGSADLDVRANVTQVSSLPPGSPFATLEEARRFAGPLPYTFDFDVPSGKMLVVRGLRTSWDPRPVQVLSQHARFFERPAFEGATPCLANAFYIENVAYAWKPGELVEAS